MNAQAIVRLTFSGQSFSHFADDVVRTLRKKMHVPEHADADVEHEIAVFRTSLDAHYPEFCELFASTLGSQLPPHELEGMLGGLSAGVAPRYLEASVHIERELVQSLPRLTHELAAAALALLARPDVRPPEHSKALSLARRTGVYEALQGLARAVTTQVLAPEGQALAGAAARESDDVERIQAALLEKLVTFHARCFVRHVGQNHAAAVLDELQHEPLASYVRARRAMNPALDRGLQQLLLRIVREVLRCDCV
jgi:hypothetical protein